MDSVSRDTIFEVSKMEKSKKVRSAAQAKGEQLAEAYIRQSSLDADPNGSYTGKCTNANEVPVQDADDL